MERGDSSFPESEESEGRVSTTVARVPFPFYFIFDLIATEIERETGKRSLRFLCNLIDYIYQIW